MFITDSLRRQVEEYLQTLESCAGWLVGLAERLQNDAPVSLADDLTTRLAAERAFQLAVECTLDAANAVIDALVMREPGGYADMIRVLAEEQVVSWDWFHAFEPVLAFRNRLVRAYVQVTAEELAHAVQAYHDLFLPYCAAMRAYLQIPQA